MRVHVKICGITDVAAARVAVESGADSLGFVLASSVRQVSPGTAAAISAELGAQPIDRVAVFRGPARNVIDAALVGFDADVVQADRRSLVGLDGRRLLPVFREGVDEADEISRLVDGGRFVYEGRRSGVGHVVDWELAARVAGLGRMTLAGGLDPDNVIEAIRTVRPFGVDVSSGVESRPGVKDPVRLRAFLEAVREAEKELVTK